MNGMQGEVKIFTVRPETQQRTLLEHKRINDNIQLKNKEYRQRRIKEAKDVLARAHEDRQRLYRNSCRRMEGSSLAVDQNEYDYARVSRLDHIAQRREIRRNRNEVIAGAKLEKIQKPLIVPKSDDVCVGKNPVGYAVNPEKVMLAMALQQKYNFEMYDQLEYHRKKITKVIAKELDDAKRLFPNASPDLLRTRNSSSHYYSMQSPPSSSSSAYRLSSSWSENIDRSSGGRPQTSSLSPPHLSYKSSMNARSDNSLPNLAALAGLDADDQAYPRERGGAAAAGSDHVNVTNSGSPVGGSPTGTGAGVGGGVKANINVLRDSDPLRISISVDDGVIIGEDGNREPLGVVGIQSAESTSADGHLAQLLEPLDLSPGPRLNSLRARSSSSKRLRDLQCQKIPTKFDSRAVPLPVSPPGLPRKLRAEEILNGR